MYIVRAPMQSRVACPPGNPELSPRLGALTLISMPRSIVLLCWAALTLPAAPAFAQRAAPAPRPSILDDIRYLTDDRLGGRLTGSPGADTAAAYLARRFPTVGLQPAAGGLVPDVHHLARRAGRAARPHVGGLSRPATSSACCPGRDPVLRNESGHRRRPLRPPRARRLRQPRSRQHRQGAQRRRRQRVGRGDADPDRRAAGGVPAGPHGRLHRLQRRGARTARLGLLREAADLSARRPRWR